MSEVEAIEQIFSEDEQLEENVVTKGAKPAEKSELHNEGEDLGGSSKETPDGGPIGKKVAAKMKKTAAPSTHPSQASGKLAEESEDAEESVTEEETRTFDVDLSSDVAALTEGEDLSAEFKTKAATIFEAAVISRINEQLEVIHEEYAVALKEEVEKVKLELAEKVDTYLNYAVTTWMEQNEIAIQNGIKTEIAESVMTGLRQVFVDNNVNIDDERVDLLDELEGQLDTMEGKLNEQIESNVLLTKKLGNYIKNGIVNEVCEGLAMSQREKMISLTESIECVSEETFRDKVQTLKESYFPANKPGALTEDAQLENTQVSDSMSAYMNAISRWS